MAKKATNGSGRTLVTYKAYNFKDKDPVIDQLRTMAQDTYGAKITAKALRQIHEAGGPSTACMAGWFSGETKRPQNPTVEAAGRAMGYQRIWQKMRSK
jgi:hypothetical protein